MATSPNYAWAEPDNSSLVKNGASDIRTLGDAIDTSVWNIGFGQAGKNKIINGDFTINQKGFTSTTTTVASGFDNLAVTLVDGTCTYSAQTFTVGAAPVAGYEATNFARLVTTGQTLVTARANLRNNIENVRTFAGQTATVSFWAKAATGTPKIAVEINQDFGSGGTPSTAVQTYAGQVTLTTSWARYQVTIAVPSISGKTIGTDENNSKVQVNYFVSAGSNLNSRTGSLGIQSNTFDIWGTQMEAGSIATPFQTATGTRQGELAACQRYYVRLGANSGFSTSPYATYGNGYTTSTTNATIPIQLPVTMRVAPTSVDFSNLGIINTSGTLIAVSAVAINTSNNSSNRAHIEATVTGATANVYQTLENNNSTSGYIGFSAEL